MVDLNRTNVSLYVEYFCPTVNSPCGHAGGGGGDGVVAYSEFGAQSHPEPTSANINRSMLRSNSLHVVEPTDIWRISLLFVILNVSFVYIGCHRHARVFFHFFGPNLFTP